MSRYKCDKCAREVCKIKQSYIIAVNTHGKYNCDEFTTEPQTQDEIDKIKAEWDKQARQYIDKLKKIEGATK